MKKILTLLLSTVLILGVCTGCKKKTKTSNDDNVTVAAEWTGKGVHEAKITERPNEYVVKDGATAYRIVVPANATEYESEAATLIVDFIEKATGAKIPVIDDGVALSSKGKYISVGDTVLMRDSGISVPVDKFGESGFVIHTKRDTVFISGARSSLRCGTYYGAQEYLYHTINWRAYTAEEVDFDKKTSIALADYDITEIPEFDHRRTSYVPAYNNTTWNRYLRLSIRSEANLLTGGHSHFSVLPPEMYFDEHRDWYYWDEARGDFYKDEKFYTYAQLCLSNQAMYEEFVDQLVKKFEENPTKDFVHLGMQDNTNFCTCDGCQAMQAEYNTNMAGLNNIFTNRVAREVSKRIEEKQPDRKLYFETFAYYATIEPPVHEENGELVPDHPEVVPDDNVYIQYTPLGRNTLETNLSEENAAFDQYLKGWVTIAKNISVWDYITNYSNFILPFKVWDTLTEQLRYYSDHNVKQMYLQGNVTSGTAQMYEMRLWISAKLMWNPSLSYEALEDEFLEHFYGAAAEKVSEAYDLKCTYYEYIMETYKPKTNTLDNADKGYWSFSFVESVRNKFAEAFEEIEYLKEENIAQYETYYWRICGAYLENMYMQLDFHMNRYNQSYVNETINLFEEVCAYYNVTAISENSTVKTAAKYIEKWRGLNA